MKHTNRRHGALTAVVVLTVALCAAMATVASATTKKGEFVGAGGKSLAGTRFTSSSGTFFFETTAGGKLMCSSATGSGEIVNTVSATYTLLLKGCALATGGACTSSGAPAGEIQLNNILIDVQRQDGGERILLLLKLLKEVEFICKSSIKAKVRGGFLTLVSAANEGKFENVVAFVAKGASGVQEPTLYEDSKGERLKGFLEKTQEAEGYKQAMLVGETELTLSGGAEGEFV